MENERFELHNVAGYTVEMAASSSKVLQIARKTDSTADPKKKSPITTSFPKQSGPLFLGTVISRAFDPRNFLFEIVRMSCRDLNSDHCCPDQIMICGRVFRPFWIFWAPKNSARFAEKQKTYLVLLQVFTFKPHSIFLRLRGTVSDADVQAYAAGRFGVFRSSHLAMDQNAQNYPGIFLGFEMSRIYY